MRALLLFGALVAALSQPALADAKLVVKRARLGDVRAELSYVERESVFSRIQLKIIRAGATVTTSRISTECRACPTAGPAGDRPLAVRRLDGDEEPEVMVDFYSGGAHCCTYSYIYRYRPDLGRYGRMTMWWGNAGYRLVDLNGDGRPEFSSGDDRFNYAFAAFAASAVPVRIWRFDSGHLGDVTRDFPPVVARDARGLWRLYRDVRRSRYREVRGVLAAWLADMYLLGRQGTGWQRLEQARRRGELGRGRSQDGYPAGRVYLRSLKAFLRRTGYARS